MDDAQLDAIERKQGRQLWLADASVVVLLAGLLVDLVYISWSDKFWTEKVITFAADFLILMGVAGELVFAHRANRSGEAIQAELKTRLAATIEGASLANQKAAEAMEAAEQAKRERAALELQIAPRRLAPWQRKSLSDSLSPLRGKRVRIESYALDVEAAALGEQLSGCLAGAGIEVNRNLLSRGAVGSIATGVLVARSTDDPEDQTGAATLNALWTHTYLVAALGEPPHTGGVHQPHDGSPVAATVFVGVKPIITEDSRHPLAKHDINPLKWWGEDFSP